MDLDDGIPSLDLSQISHSCCVLMRDLAEIQWRDFINQDPLTYWVLLLSCDVYFQYIYSRIVYFYLKYYALFFIVNVEGVPSQQLKRSLSYFTSKTGSNHTSQDKAHYVWMPFWGNLINCVLMTRWNKTPITWTALTLPPTVGDTQCPWINKLNIR